MKKLKKKKIKKIVKEMGKDLGRISYWLMKIENHLNPTRLVEFRRFSPLPGVQPLKNGHYSTGVADCFDDKAIPMKEVFDKLDEHLNGTGNDES